MIALEEYRREVAERLAGLESELADRRSQLADARQREQDARNLLLAHDGPENAAAHLRAQSFRSAVEGRITELEHELARAREQGVAELKTKLRAELDRMAAEHRTLVSENSARLSYLAEKIADLVVQAGELANEITNEESAAAAAMKELARELGLVHDGIHGDAAMREFDARGSASQSMAWRRAYVTSAVRKALERGDNDRYKAAKDLLRTGIL